MKNWVFLFWIVVFVFSGCSNDSVTDKAPLIEESDGSSGGTDPGGTNTAPESVSVTVTPATGLSALGTATVSATVLDDSGLPVPDGTVVSFEVDNTSLGGVTPTATTVSGVATATFTASNTAGTVILTATADTVSDTVAVTIIGADIGSIQFLSASPDVIGVKGSGQTENSVILFSVQDINGQPVSDGLSVSFGLSGPQGGETLNPTTASTKGGQVQTTLQSGSVAGPIRITATTTLNGATISSSSTTVSIGGGLPSMTHFSFATSTLNLAGLVYDNLQSTLTAFLADRFGNFNVLKGTSVSFYAEAGAVDASNITEETGIASVIFRTQNPRPLVHAPAGDPGNGLGQVIAVTRGEECFVDKNGNGLFDGPIVDGFPPDCDISEPFVDKDDDEVFDSGDQIYIDGNGNGIFDGPNGIWDEDRMIWQKLWVAFSGQPIITVFPDTVDVGNLSSQVFSLCVGDGNFNAPMAGSTVEVSTTGGTLTGGDLFTLADILNEPYCSQFVLLDSADEDDPAVPVSVEIKVVWKVPGHADITFLRTLSGAID